MPKDIEVEIFLKGGKKFVKDVKKTGDAAEDAGKGFSKSQANLVSLAAAMSLVSTAARAVTRVVGVLIDIGTAAVKAGSDFEEANQKFGVVFQGVAEESRTMRDELTKNFGLSTLAATELLSTSGDLLTGFGFTDKAALDLSNTIQELAVDLASFSNVQGGAARVSAIVTKSLLGEREGLKELGIAILEVDVKNRLLQKGQQDLTGAALRQAKAVATLELAYEASGKAIGDFARSSSSLANQQRILEARMEDVSVQLGQVLVPITNVFIGQLITLTEKSLEWADANKDIVATNLVEFAKLLSASFTFVANAVLITTDVILGLVGAAKLLSKGFVELQIINLQVFASILDGVASLAAGLVKGFRDPLNTIKTLFLEFAEAVNEIILAADVILPDSVIAKVQDNLAVIRKSIQETVSVDTGDNLLSSFLNNTADSLRDTATELDEFTDSQQEGINATAAQIDAVEALRSTINQLNSDIQDGLNTVGAAAEGGTLFEASLAQLVAKTEAEKVALAETQRIAQEELFAKREAVAQFNSFLSATQQGQLKAAKDLAEQRILGLQSEIEKNIELKTREAELLKAIEEEKEASIFAIKKKFREDDAAAQDKAAADKRLKEARDNSRLITIQGNFLNALGALSASVGEKNFKVSQGLKISGAIVNTYAAANVALAEFPAPYGAIAAAVVIAQGLANVNIIRQQQPTRAQHGIPQVLRAEEPAVLHMGERVLTRLETESLTDFLQEQTSDTSGGTATQRGGINVNFNVENFTLMSDDDEAIGNLTTAIARKFEEQNFVGAT